jgi:hypothetical protein
VKKTLQTWKGETKMTDKEKNLTGLAKTRRGKRGAPRRGDSRKVWEGSRREVKRQSGRHEQGSPRGGRRLRCEADNAIKEAFAAGDPAGPLAKKACELHKQWLCRYTTDTAASTTGAWPGCMWKIPASPPITTTCDRVRGFLARRHYDLLSVIRGSMDLCFHFVKICFAAAHGSPTFRLSG